MFEDRPWHKHYPKEVNTSYDYPKQNLAQFLIDSATKYPEQTALYFLGKTMTYGELLDSAYRFAHVLKGLGVKKGDRVAVMLPNCPQSVIAYYGTLLYGAIVVQTNPLYVERELEYQLKDSGATVLVVLDLLFRRVSKVQPSTNLKHVIYTSIKDYLPFPKNILYPLKVKKDGMSLHVDYSENIYSWKKLLKSASNQPIQSEIDPEEDLALLQYTGGTTGLSKGVMLTHYNLVVNTLQARRWMYKSEEKNEVFLAALPFFHVYGMTVVMNNAISAACKMILVPKFEVEEILKTIDKLKPNNFPGAPTMYIAIINHPDVDKYDLSSINICISGAAALPVEVQERFEALTGGRLVEGYGLTEASPVSHANNLWEKRKIGSIGIPWPDTEVKVLDQETGEELPVGEIGELIISGPQVMKGYWNKEEETAKALKDGWLYTGDMARMDEEGFFYIVDRKKDMIIASGYNIYPREIEEVLFEHPQIVEAAVAGVPDQYRGETVKAYVIAKEGSGLTEGELDAWCRSRLASYKVPRVYEFRNELPKTLIGKVLRRKLVEEEIEKQAQQQVDNEKTG